MQKPVPNNLNKGIWKRRAMAVRKIRIALIEDSNTIRTFYKALFMKAGFDVVEAADSKIGWEIICDEKPDVIVLDMMMPGIPGIELLKRIRSFDFSKEIPVLVLTAMKEKDQIQEIFKHGADHYSLKGMDSPELIRETVYGLLKKKSEKAVVQTLEKTNPLTGEPELNEIDKHFFWFD